MSKYISYFFIGLILVALFVKRAFDIIDIKFFNFQMVSTDTNDHFQLWTRILTAYIFGSTYFYFLVKTLNAKMKPKHINLAISIIIILLFVQFILQFIVDVKFFGKNQISVQSILPLWLSFPVYVLFTSVYLKIFKKYCIKSQFESTKAIEELN